ncbi:MAG: hypothetical protein ACRDYC_07790 [Acidimicrobiales bacterium]
MRRWMLTFPVLALAVVGGVAGCGSSPNSSGQGSSSHGGSGTTTTTLFGTGAGKEFAFCGFWDQVDQEIANATSPSQSFQIVKANPGIVADLAGTVPVGAVSSVINPYVTALQTGLQAGSFNDITRSSTLMMDRIEIDTYCGVDGKGTILPAYFDAGAASEVCQSYVPFENAVDLANSAKAVASAIRNHSSQLAKFTAETSQLPGTLAAEGQVVATVANHVKSTGNGGEILNATTALATDTSDVQLYCGVNT